MSYPASGRDPANGGGKLPVTIYHTYMVIVFATSQGEHGSTLIGRVAPLANRWGAQHTVHVLGLSLLPPATLLPSVFWHAVGHEPFTRRASGKQRQSGLRLIGTMAQTAIRTWLILHRLSPDVVVLCKALPANTLGVALYHWTHPSTSIVLDADDFELTANHLTSLFQRAAIHWSERIAARQASVIITATPFLTDHYQALTNHGRPVHMIPTGYSLSDSSLPVQKKSARPTILYLGSVSVSSGHRIDLLPDILALLTKNVPDVQLVIAGSGDDIHMLKRAFADHRLEQAVHWHGRFTAEDVPHLIAACDVLVDPIDSSISARAKSSFRAVVASAYGKPIVTSNVGIVPYLIPASLHERFFARPGDVADYAMKIQQLLYTPLLPDEQATLRTHAQQFSWEHLAPQFASYLGTVKK